MDKAEKKGFWFEMNGELYTDGSGFTEEDYEFVDSTDLDPSEIDPESWRIYADNFNAAQMAWLKKHPEHDWSGELDRQRAKGRLTEAEIRFIDSRPSYLDLHENSDGEEQSEDAN